MKSRPPRRRIAAPVLAVLLAGAATAFADPALDELSADLDVVIGTTATELDSRTDTVRGHEAAIGNLFADALRSMTGADVAMTNGGGIRGGRIYEPGAVLTRHDILTELPFEDLTVVLQVTGHDLVAALENGLGKIEEGAGRFPHVSGLSVVYDPGRPVGERVLEVRRDGAPLDLDATYTLAVNDYNAGGGDGYDFADKPRLIDEHAGKLVTSQVIDYIAAQGTVSPVVDGRLKRVD